MQPKLDTSGQLNTLGYKTLRFKTFGFKAIRLATSTSKSAGSRPYPQLLLILLSLCFATSSFAGRMSEIDLLSRDAIAGYFMSQNIYTSEVKSLKLIPPTEKCDIRVRANVQFLDSDDSLNCQVCIESLPSGRPDFAYVDSCDYF